MNRLLHCDRAGHSSLSIIVARFERSEKRKNPVAYELVDQASVTFDGLRHRRKVCVQNRDDLARIESFSEGGEPTYVDHQRTNLSALACHLQSIVVIEQACDNFIG